MRERGVGDGGGSRGRCHWEGVRHSSGRGPRRHRPSFTDAAEPAIARRLYEHFADLARADGFTVATGEFGAMMDVALVNHGPFTVVLDTDAL